MLREYGLVADGERGSLIGPHWSRRRTRRGPTLLASAARLHRLGSGGWRAARAAADAIAKRWPAADAEISELGSRN